jgi:AhpD family alkylhydroperoxidase
MINCRERELRAGTTETSPGKNLITRVPRKYRELIALGVALTTQCSYCIDVHTRHAREHGVTREELAEAAFVAAAVRAGGTLAHSLLALRLFDEGAG